MEQQGKPHCRVRARQLARTRRSLLCLSRAHRVATSGTEEDMQLRTFTNNARPPGISRLLLVNQTGTQEPSGADWTQAPLPPDPSCLASELTLRTQEQADRPDTDGRFI
ncbi:hypothetical protein GCM10008955_10340 [Deinococcus malanensis]|uniref:Uncharacterized protein n=1 Tax=Deinococcus malanensis TaxID=1706855 RepID=A0ABQ2EP09_9DEIO|nr:hypothetical protein GCM10008955_10340 [Deinococcus malanensis]